jgi:hypothetical protein
MTLVAQGSLPANRTTGNNSGTFCMSQNSVQIRQCFNFIDQ